jgi:dihydropteroate synthase
MDTGHALAHAERLVREGADILDVGGESTRPGASALDAESEATRVVPLIDELSRRLSVPISIDTRRATVARRALDAGASIVNDVSALADPAMPAVVSGTGAGVVLMHMRGTPATMQDAPAYGDVVAEIAAELETRLHLALDAGITRDRIVLDPGIGFGKTFAHNLELMSRLDRLTALGQPLLIGPSRKAFLGVLLGGAPVDERAVATAAACVVGLLLGARIFRVHDVAVVRQALVVAEAMRPAAGRAPA